MRKLIYFAAVLFIGAAVANAQTTRKVMVEEDPDAAACALDSDDFVNPIVPQAVSAVGTITTGGCFDAFTSGFAWTNAYKSVRLGKTAKDCNKQQNVQLGYASPSGRTGFLDNWDANPAGATANPCLHTDGKIYRKYTAETNP